MKKRLFAMILSICMVLNLMPTLTFAVDFQASWGVAGEGNAAPSLWVGQGTITEAINYANTLEGSTAYIQLLVDITTESALNINGSGKTTVLDLNGKTITRSTASDANSPVILVSSGVLNIVDSSVSKLGTILNTIEGNDTCGIEQQGGTVNIYSGRIFAFGQAHYLLSGTFNMHGGTLVGLWKAGDQVVHEAIVADAGTVNIYGGNLTGNGDLWLDSDVTTNIKGGNYSGNAVSSYLATGYALGDLSKRNLSEVIIPATTIGGVTYGPYTLTKVIYLRPTILGMTLPSNGTYIEGNALNFTVNYSEPIYVTTAEGTPYINLTLNSGGTVQATYLSGNGTSALVFSYNVKAGDNDANGIALGNAIITNGGTLKDSAENPAMVMLTNVGATTGILVDTLNPVVSTLSPANNSTHINVNSNLVINFNEAVIAGTGNITIKKSSDNSIVETIDVSSDQVTGFGTAFITIDPASALASETEFYVVIDSTAFKDPIGKLYLGIASATDWHFTTADASAPIVASVDVPSNGIYQSGQALNFTVQFTEPVWVVTTDGTPFIPITLNTGGTVNATYVNGSGTAGLVFRYTVQAGNNDGDGIAVGAAIVTNGGTIKDASGNSALTPLNGIGATTGVLVDTLAPTVTVYSPSDNATNVGLNSNLLMTFNENVVKGAGTIVIKNASDNSVFETIAVTSGKVTGQGTATISIDPIATFAEETNYYVQIDAGAFLDAVGNNYAGLTDNTSWNFKTLSRVVPAEKEENLVPVVTPAASDVSIVVNGKVESLGKETKSEEAGKSIVTVTLNNQAVESKISEAVKNKTIENNNFIQVMIADNQSDISKVELTGNVVKKLEENAFDVSIKRDNVEYIIPANEFTISKVASNLGVSERDLKDIKIEVQIAKLDDMSYANYNRVAKANGAELVCPPVTFDVVAKTTKADGTMGQVEISKFSNYVERVIALPSGTDANKITTGIVFNADGTYSHVPTEAFQNNGKWYAKLNSLTNSNYSIIWNAVTLKSVENHWSKETVNDMASRLVVFNVDSFDPNKAITRADFAEYIVRALGLYRIGSTHENKFSDVSATDAHTLAILIASENGIVTGYQDGTFKPDASITREEAMTMYQKAMRVTKLTGSDPQRYQQYGDYDEVASWASAYVKEVLSAHVFNGTTATTLSPKTTMTYAEAAQAIKNLLVESKLINQ